MKLMNKSSKKKLSFLLGLILLFLLKPRSAFAIFELLLAPLLFVAKLLAACIALVGISYAFVFAANAFFGWATNPASIQLPITNNPLVITGWEVVRDFTNLFFILVVVALGLSVALRTISERQVGRLILKLIVVAVLINFTPVICGVLIDIANIFMNFFLTAAGAGYNRLINIAAQSGRILMGEATSFFGMLEQLRNGIFYFKLLFIVAFNFIAGFILFLIGGLFLLRNIILWILVILAPLAFFMWILPQTQGFFKKWWNQFISWCFVGVGGAFFVFLAQVLFTQLDQILGRTSELVEGGTILTGPMAYLFTASAPLLLLVVGAQMVLSSAPQGAQIITGFASRHFAKLPSYAAGITRKGWQIGGTVASKFPGVEKYRARRIERAQQKLEADAQRISKWRQQFREGRGFAKLGAAGKILVTAPVMWGRSKYYSKIAQTRGAILTETERAKAKYQKAIEERGAVSEVVNELALPGKSLEERVGALLALQATHNLDKVPQELRRVLFEQINKLPKKLQKTFLKIFPEEAAKKEEEFRKTLTQLQERQKLAEERGDAKEAAKLSKRIQNIEKEMKEYGLWLSKEEKEEKGYRSIVDKIFAEMIQPKDIPNLRPDFYKNPAIKEAIMRFWTGREVSKAAEAFGRSFVDAVNAEVHKRGANWFFEIDEKTGRARNPQLLAYLSSTAARNFGFYGPPGGETIEEVRKLRSLSSRWEGELARIRALETKEEKLSALRNLQNSLNLQFQRAEDEQERKIISSALQNVIYQLSQLQPTTQTTPTVTSPRGPSAEEIPKAPPEEERTSEDRLRGPGPEEIP